MTAVTFDLSQFRGLTVPAHSGKLRSGVHSGAKRWCTPLHHNPGGAVDGNGGGDPGGTFPAAQRNGAPNSFPVWIGRCLRGGKPNSFSTTRLPAPSPVPSDRIGMECPLSFPLLTKDEDYRGITAPVGSSPVVAYRHRAISNLRAQATIYRLRDRPSRAEQQSRNHRELALPGWNLLQHQAIWTRCPRTIALPVQAGT